MTTQDPPAPSLRMARGLLLAALASSVLGAQSFTDEIQVYAQDIQKPGEPGLELHLNRLFQGPRVGWDRSSPFSGSVNLTPELSYGLTRELELGLYLLTARDAEARLRFGGPKLRLKWLPWQPGADGRGLFMGVNTELGRLNRGFSEGEARTNAELRFIGGVQTAHWLLAVNPILDWPLSDGFRRGTPDLLTGWKATWQPGNGFSPGLELYLEHGRLNRPGAFSDQAQSLFLTLDVDRKPFVFNVGLGRGLTATADRWTVKFIFEIPLGGG